MKLSKEELLEGITKELISSIDMSKRSSPVQLMSGDEPQKLMKCSTGYWVKLEDGTYLKDEFNKLMVFPERDCLIGRARYLLNFGHIEKKQRVLDLIETWKGLCRERLDAIAKQIKSHESYFDGNTFNKIIKQVNPEVYEFNKKYAEDSLQTMKPAYELAEQLYSDGNFIDLLEHLGIRSFPAHMFSAHYDNPQEMKVLINTFSAKAINNWDGDMLYKYAEIEVEKDYYL